LKKLVLPLSLIVPALVFSQAKKKDTATKVNSIEEVVFQKKGTGRTNDLTTVKISAKDAQNVKGLSRLYLL
jgi:hypothetical protein